jgi:hypothetical protein
MGNWKCGWDRYPFFCSATWGQPPSAVRPSDARRCPEPCAARSTLAHGFRARVGVEDACNASRAVVESVASGPGPTLRKPRLLRNLCRRLKADSDFPLSLSRHSRAGLSYAAASRLMHLLSHRSALRQSFVTASNRGGWGTLRLRLVHVSGVHFAESSPPIPSAATLPTQSPGRSFHRDISRLRVCRERDSTPPPCLSL